MEVAIPKNSCLQSVSSLPQNVASKGLHFGIDHGQPITSSLWDFVSASNTSNEWKESNATQNGLASQHRPCTADNSRVELQAWETGRTWSIWKYLEVSWRLIIGWYSAWLLEYSRNTVILCNTPMANCSYKCSCRSCRSSADHAAGTCWHWHSTWHSTNKLPSEEANFDFPNVTPRPAPVQRYSEYEMYKCMKWIELLTGCLWTATSHQHSPFRPCR